MPRKKRTKSVLLSPHVVPSRYRLFIHPDLSNFTYRGEETITLNITKPTKAITLHALGVKVGRAYLHSTPSLEATKVTYDKHAETVTLSFPRAVEGRHKLELQFSGVITDKLCGFYKSRYKVAGEDRIMATTQFEPTDARRAFPCFDEPAKKAIFDISLMVPKDFVAISNSHEAGPPEHHGEYKLVRFAPTPKMSTYLVAFIIGDMEYLEGCTKDGITVRVFVRPGKREQGRFALDVAKKFLTFYAKYFGVPYPMPLIDLVAVPDFSVGAMENWGAITYRETALLIDPKNSAASALQRVAEVIAHEFTHMWFGNLVTMKWWTHLWLNEGFATWASWLPIDKYFPQWDVWTQYAYGERGEALALDALKGTHAIEIPIHHPDEINQIFDEISYAKGGAVIDMLARFLGRESFRAGMHGYLTKHRYQNTETEDLWDALGAAADKDVRTLMRNWTGKPGYPYLTASKLGDTIELVQARFFASGVERKRSTDTTVWQIPISYRVFGTTDRPTYHLMTKKSDRLSLSKKAARSGTAIKLDAGGGGFFRIAYDDALLAAMKPLIEDKSLPAVDRLGVIGDAFALARSGVRSQTYALDLLTHYKNEDDLAVWQTIASPMNTLSFLTHGSTMAKSWEEFLHSIFAPAALRLGWDESSGDRHTDMLLRSLLLVEAGAAGDKKILTEGKRRFARYRKDHGSLEPNLRSAVYTLVALQGGENEYEQLLALYRASDLSEEKTRIMRALGMFCDPTLIERTLEWAFSKDVRAQDFAIVIWGVGANPAATEILWRFAKKNWTRIQHLYEGQVNVLARIAVAVMAHLKTKKHAREAEAFFGDKKNRKGVEMGMAKGIEYIHANLYHTEHIKRDLAQFLKDYAQG